MIAERTPAALQALKRRGKRLGRPAEQSPAARDRVAELRAGGLSLRAVAEQLDTEGSPTARWHGSTVRSVEQSPGWMAEAASAGGTK